jgi:hypothetical protein
MHQGMQPTAGRVAHAFRQCRDRCFVGEICTKPGSATARLHKRVRACACFGLLTINEKHARAKLGKRSGHCFSDLTFTTDTGQNDATTCELHTSPC